MSSASAVARAVLAGLSAALRGEAQSKRVARYTVTLGRVPLRRVVRLSSRVQILESLGLRVGLYSVQAAPRRATAALFSLVPALRLLVAVELYALVLVAAQAVLGASCAWRLAGRRLPQVVRLWYTAERAHKLQAGRSSSRLPMVEFLALADDSSSVLAVQKVGTRAPSS